MQTKLMRSESDKMVAGVCGGIAAYLNVDSVLVRFAFIMLIFASGIGLALYFILMFLMPAEGNTAERPPNDSDWDLEEDIKVYDEGVSGRRRDGGTVSNPQGPIIFAVILIAIGLFLLGQNMGILDWVNPGWCGPLVIIGIGLWVIYRRRGMGG
jgi:phage shock protein C